MKWVLSLLVFIALTAPSPSAAQELNAGFVQGLWFDTDTIFVGDTVRIYAAVRNNSGADLTGTVEFRDGDSRIGRKSVSALDGRIVESWTDWEPTYGEHTIVATLSRVELQRVGSTGEDIGITSKLAGHTVFVDYDTDGDGVGNAKDDDDDGDGIDDKTEEENDTDPLNPDDPEQEEIDTADAEDIDSATNKDTDDEDTVSKKNGTGGSGGEPQGFEQFLTENRASYALSSVTNIVNDLKRDLDRYRDYRNVVADAETTSAAESHSDSAALVSTLSSSTSSDDIATSSATSSSTTSPDIMTNKSGFGDVSRSSEKSDVGFLTKMTRFLRTIIEILYTFVLFVLSLYLSNPIVVQVTLLLLILFFIYKIARHLGQRQQ